MEFLKIAEHGRLVGRMLGIFFGVYDCVVAINQNDNHDKVYYLLSVRTSPDSVSPAVFRTVAFYGKNDARTLQTNEIVRGPALECAKNFEEMKKQKLGKRGYHEASEDDEKRFLLEVESFAREGKSGLLRSAGMKSKDESENLKLVESILKSM